MLYPVPKKVVCEVPQWSILGPLLFLIYITDLALLSDILYSLLYVYDTTMFISGPKIHELQLNGHFHIASDWLNADKLSWDVEKNEPYGIYQKKKKTTTKKHFSTDDMNITINGLPAHITNSTKFWCVFIALIDDKQTRKKTDLLYKQ